MIRFYGVCLSFALAFFMDHGIAHASLKVGFAVQDVTPPIGVPLAGYGGGNRRKFDLKKEHQYADWMAPSKGVMDPIRAKTMVLTKGGRNLVFISLDLIAVTGDFKRDLIKQIEHLGFDQNNVFMSATHTHSGPGTISRNTLWKIITMDRFKKKIFQEMIRKTALSIEQALANQVEADLYRSQFYAENLQRNRRNHPGHVDQRADLVLARTMSGEWLGGIVNFAIHGTMLGTKNMLFSADVNGAIEYGVQEALDQMNGTSRSVGSTILFINAAEGDVSPNKSGEHNLEYMGKEFARQSIPAIHNAQFIGSDFYSEVFKIRIGKARVNLRACATPDPGEGGILSKIVPSIRINISKWMPKSTRLGYVEFGKELIMMSWPGEPTTSLGYNLKQVAHQLGYQHQMLLGLTNDHLSYFTTPTEYNVGGYEACASFYGENGGQHIVNKYRDHLAGRLAK